MQTTVTLQVKCPRHDVNSFQRFYHCTAV